MEGQKMQGRVKFWNSERGFGFIARDDAHGDVFCHVRDLPEDMDELTVGMTVEFEASASQRRPGSFEAKNVKVI